MIPAILSLSSRIEFSNVEAQGIASSFKNTQVIDYRIKDGKLEYTGLGNNTKQYVKI